MRWTSTISSPSPGQIGEKVTGLSTIRGRVGGPGRVERVGVGAAGPDKRVMSTDSRLFWQGPSGPLQIRTSMPSKGEALTNLGPGKGSFPPVKRTIAG